MGAASRRVRGARRRRAAARPGFAGPFSPIRHIPSREFLSSPRPHYNALPPHPARAESPGGGGFSPRRGGNPMSEIAAFTVNIGSALLMGMAIGLERQFRQHPAGLRTNALVCMGAALFVSLSFLA